MSLLIGALIGLLAVLVSRDPAGRLWRLLVAAPAALLNRLTWRHVAVVVLAMIFLELFTQIAMPHMAVILAVDIVGWIDVLAATLIVTRLLPGWRALKVSVRGAVRAVSRPYRRTPRARRIRRPSATSDEVDPTWGPAWALT